MIIKIKVHPHSGREEISPFTPVKALGEKPTVPFYKVYLKKPAEDNKANIELLKLLRRHFGVEAKIIKGLTSRNKIVKIGD